MKPRFSKQRGRALTRFDVLVAVLIAMLLFAILFAMILPVQEAIRYRAARINCVNNLKQISLACRVWEGDHNSQYPMSVSLANSSAMELLASGDGADFFKIMFQATSNELSTW